MWVLEVVGVGGRSKAVVIGVGGDGIARLCTRCFQKFRDKFVQALVPNGWQMIRREGRELPLVEDGSCCGLVRLWFMSA